MYGGKWVFSCSVGIHQFGCDSDAQTTEGLQGNRGNQVVLVDLA